MPLTQRLAIRQISVCSIVLGAKLLGSNVPNRCHNDRHLRNLALCLSVYKRVHSLCVAAWLWIHFWGDVQTHVGLFGLFPVSYGVGSVFLVITSSTRLAFCLQHHGSLARPLADALSALADWNSASTIVCWCWLAAFVCFRSCYRLSDFLHKLLDLM